MFERADARRSSTRRCSAASATRSSPTPSRKPTACCTPTARRRSRSSDDRRKRDHARRARTSRGRVARRCDALRSSCVKPDGRALTLYARAPLAAATSRRPARSREPLRGERAPALASAARRVGHLRGATARTALSCRRREYNPLAPTRRPGASDRAAGRATGTSRCSTTAFPSLGGPARATPPSLHRADRAGRRPLRGGGLHAGPRRLAGRAAAGPHRAAAAGVGRPHARASASATTSTTCLPFENRGAEVGVTLHHPHGQIYAYPVVPPVPARMQRGGASTSREHGRGLLADDDRAPSGATARACSTRARTRSPSCRCARAIRTKCGSRRSEPVAQFADLDDGAARRPGARARRPCC